MTDPRTLSGLEQLQAHLASGAEIAPIAQHFGMTVVSFAAGEVVFEGVPDRTHYNPIGTVHGGFAATLLDSACGTAVHTTLRPGQAYTSLEIKVSFLRPMTADTGPVRVRGRVVKSGARAKFVEAELRDSTDVLLATATSTCAIFPAS